MAFCENCGSPLKNGKRCSNCGFISEHDSLEQISSDTSIFSNKVNNEEQTNKNPIFTKVNDVVSKYIDTNEAEIKFKETLDKVMDTKESDIEYDEKDIEENRLFAILSYLGILALIPFFLKKESAFTQYHAKQGINLAIWMLGYNVVVSIIVNLLDIILPNIIIGAFNILFGIVNVGFIALAVLGIVNVVNNKARELPFMDKLKIVK